MKKIISIIFCAGILFVTNAQPIKVAIFDPAGNVPNDIKTIVREELSVPMVDNPNQFEVLERAMIDQIAKEQKFQLSGEVDNNQISELGKKLGANYVCVSSITQTGNNYYIAVKLVAVATALVKKQVNQMTQKGVNDIYQTVQEIAQKLVSGISPANNNSIFSKKINPVTKTEEAPAPVVSDMDYQEFKLLLKEQGKSMLQGNKPALAAYQKYKNLHKAGWWTMGAGLVTTLGLGVGLTIAMEDPTPLFVCMPIGLIATLTGVGLLVFPTLKQTYTYYVTKTKRTVSFNVTPIVSPTCYGASMAMKF